MALGTAYSGSFTNRYGTWPKDGLQLMFWDNNLGSYPRSGSSIKDLSGHGRNGTLQNFASPPTSSSGYYDGAIQYDGNNDYIGFPNSWLGGSTEFSIYFIFNRKGRPNSHNSYTTGIFSGSAGGSYARAGNYGAGWTISIHLIGSLTSFHIDLATGNVSGIVLNNAATNFFHVAICIKAGSIKTYFNGALCDQRSSSIGTISTSGFIPSILGKYEPQEAWFGAIPVFMAYDKFIEQEDVSQIYNYFKRLYY